MNNAGKCQQNGNCGNDAIVRNVAATNQTVAQSSWTDISQGFFGPGQVAGIYPSGGHTNLTVYALTSSNSIINYPPGRGPGQLWKGQSTNQAPISSWTLAMGTAPNNNLIQAYNIFVNPFDPNELYAVDLGDKTIKTSRDGGQSWDAIAKLKDIATNNGEFDFACASSSGAPSSAYRDKDIFGNQCPLTDMYFSREAPDIRVATLYPGGVAFSNDGGLTWTSLDINSADPSMQPIELPHSAFYDHRTSTLYVAFEGKGVKRIDLAFIACLPLGSQCPADQAAACCGGYTCVVNFPGQRTGICNQPRGCKALGAVCSMDAECCEQNCASPLRGTQRHCATPQ